MFLLAWFRSPGDDCICEITLRGSHRSKFRNLGMSVFISLSQYVGLRVLVLIIRSWSALLNVKWSKTIQFRDRVVSIPLPYIIGSSLCPVTAICRALFFTRLAPQCFHAFAYYDPSLPGDVFSPTELSCPSLGTAWTSWGMFPPTLWVILFVGVELPLPLNLGSLSNSLRC